MNRLRFHFLQHVLFEGPADLGEWLEKRGHAVRISRLYEEPNLPDVDDFDAAIVLGGPMSVHDESLHRWLRAEKQFIELCLQRKKYLAGICLGAQMIAHVMGARVKSNPEKEIGWFKIRKAEGADQSRFLAEAGEGMVFHWHGETFEVPQGALRCMESDACPNQAFEYGGHVLALQFHYETNRTAIERLIANCGKELVPSRYVQKESEILRGIQLYGVDMQGQMVKVFDAFEQAVSAQAALSR